MSEADRGQLRPVKQTAGGKKAVLFIHGFTGDSDDTWGLFPDFLGKSVPDWDIYTLGYATTLQPDIVGVWSADPDLPILATMVRTELGVSPLNAYREVALVAHSMGGLIVQQALVDDLALGARIRHLVLFGTPSNGLRKAWFLAFWKRQLRNMAVGSPFIKNLRANWTKRFGAKPPFDLVVIAGDKDQFVPPGSSLDPFDKAFHRVVRGNHLGIVKPENPEHLGLRVLTATLSAGMAQPAKVTAPVKLEAERPDASIEKVLGDIKTEAKVVDAALALERAGKRPEAIQLLEENQQLGTDVRGVLAGRIKRLWIETESRDHAQRSLGLYEAALEEAVRKNDHAQAYYHAINVAFFYFVVFDRKADAVKKAQLALQHCDQAKDDVWNRATRAEASLYLGDPKQAIEQYRLLPKQPDVKEWQLASTAQQAGIVACKLEDRNVLDALEQIFTPGARKVGRIFLSYSHTDSDWKDRLCTMLDPYLRDGDTELQLWVDREIKPGDDWFQRIKTALDSSTVAVLLVSAKFLGSKFVLQHELPQIVTAAKQGSVRLLWVYLSPAGYDATALRGLQATHDLAKPLSALPVPEQDAALLDIARNIKSAALASVKSYTSLVN